MSPFISLYVSFNLFNNKITMLNNEPDLDNEGYAVNKFSDKVNEIISPQLTRNNSTSYLGYF